MKGSLPAAHQAQTVNAVVAVLSQCLDLDADLLIPELRKAEEVRQKNSPPAADAGEQVAGEPPEEQMDEEEESPKNKLNGKAAKVDNDYSDLVPVSGITAYYITHWGTPAQKQAVSTWVLSYLHLAIGFSG